MGDNPRLLGIADHILASFSPLLSLVPEELDRVGVLVAIPVFTVLPPMNRFLVLGASVDSGQYSGEVTVLPFALVSKFPEHVAMLRGNPEFAKVNAAYGFKAEATKLYGTAATRIYDDVNSCFEHMPLAALCEPDIFCVQGGISLLMSSLCQVKSIDRPIPGYDNAIVCDPMWSDPSGDVHDYERSTRGTGACFGAAVRDFQKITKIHQIIRTHQYVQNGVERFAEDIVFSSSCYQEATDNRCGLIFINVAGEVQSFSLPPVQQLPREKAVFARHEEVIAEGVQREAASKASLLCLMPQRGRSKRGQ
jgi:diadenosine tetraphosphatase ApaH/serine/threonine PP2A family protein phosphatase